MPLYIYAAACGVVASLFVLKWAVSGTGHTRNTSAVRRNLGVPTSSERREMYKRPGALVRMVDRLSIFGSGEALQRRIAIAGLGWRSSSVRFFRFVSIGLSVLLGALLAFATGSFALFVGFVLLGATAAVLPDVFIRAKADERQKTIERELPDILDRLKISLEAGLGFDSALASVVRDRTGPAYTEFKRVLQDLQLGVPRDEALQALSDRTTIPDLRIVLSAVLQSSRYGLPLVEVMRVQTDELRDKRWNRAQEQALKIPVKILFPLILCIMPMFFVVLAGPGVIQLFRSL